LPFASGSENSGALLPIDGTSAAKTAVPINDVKRVKSSFFFI
jgi:hypothetical protein